MRQVYVVMVPFTTDEPLLTDILSFLDRADLLVKGDAMERMILRFQLDAAQQSIIDMERELAETKKANAVLEAKLNQAAEIQLDDKITKQEQLAKQIEGTVKTMVNRVKELTTINGELKKKTMCQMCTDRQRDVVLVPCMHFLYCGKCVKERKKQEKENGSKLTCPSCGVRICGRFKCKWE